MLQLRHIFLGRGFFRERPGQHELGLEDCSGRLHSAVERSCHPAQHWMPYLSLHVREDLASISLIPASIQPLGGNAKLDDEIAR